MWRAFLRLLLWIVEEFSSKYWLASLVRMSKIRSQSMNRLFVGQMVTVVQDQEIRLYKAQGQMLVGK